MALPASEIAGWMEFFSIYPFTQDREDYRMAMICDLVNMNTQGRAYRDAKPSSFAPNFLAERVTDEQKQINAELAFAARYEAATRG
jgi:hypothetical protein